MARFSATAFGSATMSTPTTVRAPPAPVPAVLLEKIGHLRLAAASLTRDIQTTWFREPAQNKIIYRDEAKSRCGCGPSRRLKPDPPLGALQGCGNNFYLPDGL
jgi:hypothetical protein